MFIVCDYLVFFTHPYLLNIPLAAGHNNHFSLQFVFYACLLLLDQEMLYHTKNHRPLLERCSLAWQNCLSHQVKKKKDGNGNRFVDDKSFINKRKPSSTTVAKGVSNNGEHTLIPVTAKMIHSAVWDLERFILKDDQPLHMVKLVGAVRNFCWNIKHVQIDVEDGTGLVQVILWRNKRDCTAHHCLLDKCNSNCYICVIGEVEDYYGVHKIIAIHV
jgi:hypothetical protein